MTPFSIISVDCDGNFTTFSPEFLGMKSSTYGDFVLGNVRNDTFESVCTTKKFQKMYQDITAGVELCQNSGYCPGGPGEESPGDFHCCQGEAWCMWIDKVGLLCYKHSVLAIERLGRRCEACEDAWG